MKPLSKYILEAVGSGQISLADIYNKYDIFFHGYTAVNQGVGSKFDETAPISGGTVNFPIGTVLGLRHGGAPAEDFLQDYGIKKMVAQDYLRFERELSINGLTAESPDISIGAREEQTFTKCTFNTARLQVIADSDIKFNNVKGKVGDVELGSPNYGVQYPAVVSAKSSKIIANTVRVTLRNCDYADVESLFLNLIHI